VDYFLDPANTTNKNLADYLSATDSNTALVWLGQNDTGKYTAAQWKQKVLDLITRYKTARPDMDFVLVSSYDTDTNAGDGNQLGEYARVLHEIAQSDPDVLFLNLFKAAGGFNSLNGIYLSDGVHPSAAGADYFAGKTQDLLALADSSVPEPGVVVLCGAGSVLALGRRRRKP
jgi:lysophospholipase L1-like esterase